MTVDIQDVLHALLALGFCYRHDKNDKRKMPEGISVGGAPKHGTSIIATKATGSSCGL